MGNFKRKMQRNMLKQELKTNKIKEEYHARYDTLEQKMKRMKGKGKENGKIR